MNLGEFGSLPVQIRFLVKGTECALGRESYLGLVIFKFDRQGEALKMKRKLPFIRGICMYKGNLHS